MRNLKLKAIDCTVLQSNVQPEGSKLCSNQAAGFVYCCTLSGIVQISKEFDSKFEIKWEDTDVVVPEIIAADYVASHAGIVVVTKEDILKYDFMGIVDVEGTVSDGIEAASWSPDEEILTIVTSKQDVILMSSLFEPVSETSLIQQDFGTKDFINVGWGKKETQFHGREGKEAAKIKKSDVTPIPEDAPRDAVITWRGDAQLFAVGYVCPQNGNRKFRVFDRQGILQSTSEDLDKLEHPLNWKPSGSVMASSQIVRNQHKIVFFEKNGLKHGEFVFHEDSDVFTVKKILWSPDSSVLLIWLIHNNSKDLSTVQLWTTGNYHWYLKQQEIFSSLYDLCWDQTEPLTLNILRAEGYCRLRYAYEVSSSSCQMEGDDTTVAVIDGRDLLMTPFRRMVVPPPVSAVLIKLPEAIHEVGFADSPNSDPNSFFVHHGQCSFTFFAPSTSEEGDSRVSILNEGPFAVKCNSFKCLGQVQITAPSSSGRLYNCFWLDESCLAACHVGVDGTHQLIWFTINLLQSSVKIKKIKTLNRPIINILRCSKTGLTAVQLISGRLERLADGEIQEWKSPVLCNQMSIALVDGIETPIGLTDKNQLFLEMDLIMSDCNSFLIHDEHLIATTTSHKMFVIELRRDCLLNVGDCNENGIRSVERGSRLVAAVSYDTKVMLQMPRGNLETVWPRPLVIHSLKKKLNELKYNEAFQIMRRNRIDLNLIYDHNPKLFEENVTDFIKKVGNPHWIDIFVANLTEESVVATTYSFAYSEVTSECTEKVKRVCTLVRSAMESLDKDKFILPTLTTYVRTSEMGAALVVLQALKDQNKAFEESLRHLMYVADANELCDVALETYDFDLIMMVYQKSQKDPKEYIPFLNSLKALDPPYRKYRINVHLKKYTKAIQSALECPDTHFPEIVELIKKNKLYKDAITIFSKHTSLLKRVCHEYGCHLSQRSYNTEAALMFRRAGSLQNSLDSYKSAGNWKCAISTAYEMKKSPQEMKIILKSLVEAAIERSEYLDAAHILEWYLGEHEASVEHYLKAGAWNDAIRVSNVTLRPDLIECNVNETMGECHGALLSNIQTKTEEFQKLLERLRVVRTTKYKEYEDWMADVDDDNADPDLCSDASTVTGVSFQRSQFSTKSGSTSAKTYRSGKNKRKLERKKYSTKEGSHFEDLGLIAALYDLMVETDKLTGQAYELNCILLRFAEDSKASRLQSSLESLIDRMKAEQTFVWSLQNESNEDPEFGPELSANAAVNAFYSGNKKASHDFFTQRMKELEAHYRVPPAIGKIPWKLSSI